MLTTALPGRRFACVIAALAFGLGAGPVRGAAFALQEQSGSGLGNAYAGGAAGAEDASTVWANPAGMARFSTINAVIAGTLVAPSIKFSNSGSLPALNQPLGGNGGNAGSLSGLPAMYLVVPISKSWAVGLGIGAPFGLKSDWDEGWLGRYQGLYSEIKTINVNPAVSWRANDALSVGAGINFQKVDATLTNNVNYSGALLSAAAAAGVPPATQSAIAAATPGLDATARLEGSDYAWGWNLGVLWSVNSNTRFGAHYRSSLKYDVVANVNFTYPTIPPVPPALAPTVDLLAAGVNEKLASGGVTSSLELPAIASASIFSTMNAKWDLMADVQWTQWSTIPELRFVRTTGAVLSVTPENFKDTWRVSGGANYRYSDQWKFRIGLAWDQSPVQTAERTPRLPDADRAWVALGAQYAMGRNWKFDAGYAFVTATGAPSENQNAGSTAANGLISGDFDVYVNLFSDRKSVV